MIDQLKAYAMEHYEAGGHWIFETYSDADYQREIDFAGGSFAKAKKALKLEWKIINEQSSNCY